jgi:hypothetical protein
MSSPASNYQKEMHRNLGFFATWLPATHIQLGDFGVFEGGRFRRVGTLTELGIKHNSSQKGKPQNLSYSAATERTVGGSAEATPLFRWEVPGYRFDSKRREDMFSKLPEYEMLN